ncbi:hypothetical protein RO3G_02148 [Rhizopus delemar RA 99-880]|uniref:Uncharacterized protein n=1 Tax=Rhizopus delemar (strain RA 99-880 / ATCC MYA-4621 / FGSC 9543 / NRRL 43880) TaxID=246409 RepID=I1BML4_RHIO9|nr:hypothetical protein RO3G_02148 [Rhizopus delemar RA 99-880]|eukprot:EIE77444.1 hypothetical protein RO3G_02148 [Rhizopus delemar RA 99-880]
MCKPLKETIIYEHTQKAKPPPCTVTPNRFWDKILKKYGIFQYSVAPP